MSRPADDPLLPLAQQVSDGGVPDWLDARSKLAPEDREAAELLRALAQELGWLGTSAGTATSTHWGPFEILERLGSGSFGEVYRARDTRLDRQVALKLRPAAAGTPQTRRGLVREGKLLARLRHSNVATVHSVEEHDGRVGLVMELVAGRNLESEVEARGPFSIRETALIAVDVCQALGALHEAGIVHRDVKAQNVLREPGGRVVLVDLGIGTAPAAGLAASTLSGTPLYMAPELLRGMPSGVSTDLYSLGILLFYLVSGRFPVEAESVTELVVLHEQGERQILRQLRPDVPRGFADLVERLLAPEPSARPAGAKDVERCLRALLDPGRASELRIRGGAVVALIGSLAILGALQAWQILERWRGDEAEEMAAEIGDPLKALFDKAMDLKSEGNLADARNWFELLLERTPDHLRARVHLSSCLDGLGDFSGGRIQSEEAMKRAELASEADQTWVRMMVLFNRLQYEDALEAAQRLTTLNPRDADAWRQRAHLFERLRRLNDAVDSIERAAALDPANLGLLAQFRIEQGRFGDALEVVRQARLRLAGQHSYLLWMEGLALFGQERREEAEVRFRQLADSPGEYDSVAEHLLAELEAAFDDPDAARRRLVGRRGARDGYWFYLDRQLEAALALEARDRAAFAEALRPFDTLPGTISYLRNHRTAALLWAEAGEAQAMKPFAEKLAILAEVFPSRISRGSLAQVRAEEALLAGDLERADEQISTARREWDDASTLRTAIRIAEARSERGKHRRLLESYVDLRLGELLREGNAFRWWQARRELERLSDSKSP